MIQIHSIHHNELSSGRTTRSHILTPHDAVSLFCIVDGENESIVSILEDHILESISSVEWNMKQIGEDFSFITENYNAFIKNITAEDLHDISLVLGMLQGENLTLSTIGTGYGVFLEKGEFIDLGINEVGSHEFQSITNGKIPKDSTIYLANQNLMQFLGEDTLEELALLESTDFRKTGIEIIQREVEQNIHIIRISHPGKAVTGVHTLRNRKQSDILRDKTKMIIEYVKSKRLGERLWELFQKIPKLENKKTQYTFIGVGVVILFTLSYILISSIIGVINNPEKENKNLLIQAKLLIDESQKMTANQNAFNTKISEAEKILFTLRDEQMHILDTQELLGRISSLKKQVYDIQSIDISNFTSVVPFNPAELTPLGVVEQNKKLTLVGEESAIVGFVNGDTSIKAIRYPGEERIKNFDISDDGILYALTTTNNIITPRRDTFAYINVTGQTSWESAISIKTFNGNIYLLDTSKSQIYKHKPGVNGFSQKSGVLPKEQNNIFEMSIDGGIYMYLEDGKILRYTGKGELQSIILNKIPGEWSLEPTKNTICVTRNNLSYIYILNGDRIWIFQPDSKRFQDIKAWNYIGQFEIKSNSPLRHIYIPRDGTIYATTKDGVYEMKFEFVDGKVIFK